MPRFTFYAISGLVFGLSAIPAAVIGSTVGATLAYLLARGVLRGAFRRLVDRRPPWRATLAAIDAEGWRLVALTRLASPLPGGAINYVYGLTGIPLVPYMLGTAGGLLRAGDAVRRRSARSAASRCRSRAARTGRSLRSAGLRACSRFAVIADRLRRRARSARCGQTEDKTPALRRAFASAGSLRPAARAADRAARRDAAGGPCRRTAPRTSAASSARSRTRAPAACRRAGP